MSLEVGNAGRKRPVTNRYSAPRANSPTGTLTITNGTRLRTDAAARWSCGLAGSFPFMPLLSCACSYLERGRGRDTLSADSGRIGSIAVGLLAYRSGRSLLPVYATERFGRRSAKFSLERRRDEIAACCGGDRRTGDAIRRAIGRSAHRKARE